MCSLEIPDASSCAPSLLSECLEAPVQNKKMEITCKLTRKIIKQDFESECTCVNNLYLVMVYLRNKTLSVSYVFVHRPL